MRKKITIPADGETLNIGLAGRSFVVEAINPFSTPAQVPLIITAPYGDDYPAYPRAQFGSFRGRFTDLVIMGTAESAGDELEIYVTDECLKTEFSVQLTDQYRVEFKEFTVTADNSVQTLPQLNLQNGEGVLPAKVYINVKGGATRGVNWRLINNPVQGYGDENSIYLDNDPTHTPYEPKSLSLAGLKSITQFKFVASVNGENPVLNLICEY